MANTWKGRKPKGKWIWILFIVYAVGLGALYTVHPQWDRYVPGITAAIDRFRGVPEKPYFRQAEGVTLNDGTLPYSGTIKGKGYRLTFMPERDALYYFEARAARGGLCPAWIFDDKGNKIADNSEEMNKSGSRYASQRPGMPLAMKRVLRKGSLYILVIDDPTRGESENAFTLKAGIVDRALSLGILFMLAVILPPLLFIAITLLAAFVMFRQKS